MSLKPIERFFLKKMILFEFIDSLEIIDRKRSKGNSQGV